MATYYKYPKIHALIKKLDLTKTPSIDARLYNLGLKNFNIDSVIQRTFIKDNTLNILDSYAESNQSSYLSTYYIRTQIAQAFTCSLTRILDSCKFYIALYDIPNQYVRAKLYNMTGTYGSTAKPTGDPIAVSDDVLVNGNERTYYLQEFKFTGANRVQLTAGTRYCIAFENSYGNGSGTLIRVGLDSTSSAHGGNYSYLQGSTWYATTSNDLCFYVYGITEYGPSPRADSLLNKELTKQLLINSILKKTFTNIVDINACVNGPVRQVTGLDAAVGTYRETILSGLLNKLNFNKQLSIDSYLQLTYDEQLLIDAFLIKTAIDTKQLLIDSITQKSHLLGIGLDSSLYQIDRIIGTALEAILYEDNYVINSTIHSIIQKTFIPSISLDALLSTFVEFIIDSYLFKNFIKSFSMDALMGNSFVFMGMDAVIYSDLDTRPMIICFG